MLLARLINRQDVCLTSRVKLLDVVVVSSPHQRQDVLFTSRVELLVVVVVSSPHQSPRCGV